MDLPVGRVPGVSVFPLPLRRRVRRCDASFKTGQGPSTDLSTVRSAVIFPYVFVTAAVPAWGSPVLRHTLKPAFAPGRGVRYACRQPKQSLKPKSPCYLQGSDAAGPLYAKGRPGATGRQRLAELS